MKRIKDLITTIIYRIIKYSKTNLFDNWIELTFLIKKIFYKKPGKYRPIDRYVLRAYNKHRNKRKKFLLCHAPFKSFRIQTDGTVISCCLNRTQTLGKFPDNSFSEIWKGEKLLKLRSYIVQNDLSLGCNICYEMMKNKNYLGVPAIFYDDYSIEKDHPVILEFELDNTCNLECIMCCGTQSALIREKKEKRPPLKKIFGEKFLKELETIIPKLQKTYFAGGEPFLINIYYSIWEKLIVLNPNCVIIVQTNGTILNENIKELLNRGNFIISLSLDSLKKETYEKIRVNADFDTTMSNFQYFAEYANRKGHNLSVTICPMRVNWQELPELVSFCNKIGAIVGFNNIYTPTNLAIWNLPSQQLRRVYEFLSTQVIAIIGITSEENNMRYKYFTDQLKSWLEDSIKRESDLNYYSSFSNKHLADLILMRLKKYLSLRANIRNWGNFEETTLVLSNHLSSMESDRSKKSVLISLNNMPDDVIYEILMNKSHESFVSSTLKDIVLQPFDNEDNFVFKYD